ncbi:hypothetical protein OROMI_028031 [Orobanche minor]
MAENEPVDPKGELEGSCKAPCMRPLKEYQRRALKEFKTMNLGTSTVLDNTSTIGTVLTNAYDTHVGTLELPHAYILLFSLLK